MTLAGSSYILYFEVGAQSVNGRIFACTHAAQYNHRIINVKSLISDIIIGRRGTYAIKCIYIFYLSRGPKHIEGFCTARLCAQRGHKANNEDTCSGHCFTPAEVFI